MNVTVLIWLTYSILQSLDPCLDIGWALIILKWQF